MTDMVEAVARAICCGCGLNGSGCAAQFDGAKFSICQAHTYRKDARAAIEAMREPDQQMLDAVKPWPAHWAKDGPDYPARHAAYLTDQVAARSDWQTMIDAALTNGEEL